MKASPPTPLQQHDYPHVYHIVPFTSFPNCCHRTQNHQQARMPFCHVFSGRPAHQTHKHRRHETKRCFFPLSHENNAKSALVVGQAGRPVLFTCRPYIDVISSAAFQQEEGCGSFEARGKHHVQPLSSYFITYMLRSMTVEVLYVTLVTAYDGWSSTAAERGTGTGTGNAHR